MSSQVALDSSQHQAFGWKAYPDYRFAERDHAIPLLPYELHLVVCHYAIAFIKADDVFVPMLLQGIYPEQNLCIDLRGEWRFPYIPRYYQCRPFSLARNQNSNLVVCIDPQCLLESAKPDKLLFQADGTPSAQLAGITQELAAQEQGLLQARVLAAALAKADLLVPWDLKVRVDEKRELAIAGLYKIDEEKLQQLPDNVAADLNRTGALYLAHCQLISLQHVQALINLLAASTAPPSSVLGALDRGGTISFDNI